MKSGQFEFEAKLMFWGALIFIGLALLVGLVLPWILEQLAIDRCLDAGGGYDYQQRICSGAETAGDRVTGWGQIKVPES